MFDLEAWKTQHSDYDKYTYAEYTIQFVGIYNKKYWKVEFDNRVCTVPRNQCAYIPKKGSHIILKYICGTTILGIVIDGNIFKDISREEYNHNKNMEINKSNCF